MFLSRTLRRAWLALYCRAFAVRVSWSVLWYNFACSAIFYSRVFSLIITGLQIFPSADIFGYFSATTFLFPDFAMF